MKNYPVISYLKNVLLNRPSSWLDLTTHRLDIYNEALAKTEFTEAFDQLYLENNYNSEALKQLPTAYDYIRLGHPLSCVLEWTIAKLYKLNYNRVISFSSQITPILAILRTNLLAQKTTQILYHDTLPKAFNAELIKRVYGYNFELKNIKNQETLDAFQGTTVFISNKTITEPIVLDTTIDFYINLCKGLGSLCLITGIDNTHYISAIQHVRRRETIAMTPANCLKALNLFAELPDLDIDRTHHEFDKAKVLDAIKKITHTTADPLVGSSGLSVQYAIMMGLINDALDNHKGKTIKFLVPPNCYGGTNDQARRVAACLDHVDLLDLPVDGDNDMIKSIDRVLSQVAHDDAIPYIIVEIPTNPRVEVPDLDLLKAVLTKTRRTKNGEIAIAPVFILDQTFCPNINFLGTGGLLSEVKAISYASGSKFPSAGKCTAGYCIANHKARYLLKTIANHLLLCDNEATSLQYKILAEQLPSMLQRINDAYNNTRAFVNFIETTLPESKINFVSEVLATQGFTPSVFSLDLPTKGNTPEEKEAYKRDLNHKLINLMITQIPNESKYCVSYGQLRGCYWTIPATSTQGTTKEGDKDYIARVALSPNMDLERHKKVFKTFVDSI